MSRISALASRHEALGSSLPLWNNMGAPITYATDKNVEAKAICEAAGLLDVSALTVVRLKGPDATKLADHISPRNIAKLKAGKAIYGPILTTEGTICDDAITYKISEDELMHVFGGESLERLQESLDSLALDATITVEEDLHNISLQGPKSVEILAPLVDIDLPALAFFSHSSATILGHPCRISRTGFTGERGYEIFVDREVAPKVWDGLLEHGAAHGLMPCSLSCIGSLRIEAALLFHHIDMDDTHTPWEVGLGFTVNKKKGDFRGKEAVLAAEGKEKIKLVGIEVNHNAALTKGDVLQIDGNDVGVVNSPTYSQRLQKSIALVHVDPSHAAIGTKLDVVGQDISTSAIVVEIPFHDPKRERLIG